MKKKHLIFVVGAALFIVWISVLGSLNYQNYCISKGKTLSNEEKIRLIITEVNGDSRIRLEIPFVDVDGIKKEKLVNFNQIPYDSTEAFVNSNPDCCEIHQYKNKGGQLKPPSTFFSRVMGGYAGEAFIKYKAHYLDENNLEKIAEVKTRRTISNCGNVDID